MSERAPDQIAVTFDMTADEYARYFAIVRRRDGGGANVTAYVLALFCAIPVALMFRFIVQRWSYDSATADLAGRCSLFAFLFGAFAMVAAGFVVSRLGLRKYLSGAINPYESKTAVFDANGLAVTGQISRATWQWAAISRVTNEGNLLLIWIGRPVALVIPWRCFGSDDERTMADRFIRARLSEVTRRIGHGRDQQ